MLAIEKAKAEAPAGTIYAKGIQIEAQRPPGYLTSMELTQAVGITYRQLDHWATVGWIVATERNPGYGNVRFYSPAEVEVTSRMAKMIRAGIGPEAACRAARNDGQLAPGVRIVLDEEAA